MPSIHPDYEYDIFISYRQNDNKRDGWVTRFVAALRDELDATLKNPISIYFDENPHDGLLETHLVDATLAKKLKCLVFIPIISQTYCDETSFAWEHEFLPFVEMAKKDGLGMNITLSNGNVASRVLPIKIHDLDTDDQHTLEAVLDGPLRSIDFIYKEPGVNSPLKPSDDRKLNLNKTDYEYQINKVANALKDIGLSIIKQSDGEITLPTKPEQPPELKPSKKGVYVALSIIIIALLSFWGYKQFYTSPPAELEDITIAVLAFDDQSPDGDQEYLGDGIAGAIINLLGKVNGLNVIGKTSSFSFKGKGATIGEIGEELNADMIVDGSIIVVDSITRISVQLIDVPSSKQVWSDNYDRQEANLLAIIDRSAQSIASSLRNELSIEELENIKVVYEVDPDAYEYYLKGTNIHWDKVINTNWGDDKSFNFYFDQAQKMYLKAISINPNYADAYAGLAGLYQVKGGDYHEKRDSVIKIGYRIDPNSAYILAAIASELDGAFMDSSFFLLKRANEIESTNTLVNTEIMDNYGKIGLYDNAISQANKIIMLDPLNMYVRRRLIAFLMWNGNFEKARTACNAILNIDANNPDGLGWKAHIALFIDNNDVVARGLLDKLQNLDSGLTELVHPLMLAMDGKIEALNLSKNSQIYSLLNMKKEAVDRVDSISSIREFTRGFTYLNLKNEPAYEFIRDEPRFQKLLARAKIVHDERVAKYGHLFDEE